MTEITIDDITNKFKALEKEIRDLKYENEQVKGVFAAVMKRVKTVDDFDIKEVYTSDYKKVHIKQHDDIKVSILYMDEIKEEQD